MALTSLLPSAELRAQRVAIAQAMQQKKAAKIAAKKEQLEKAKVARAASMAAKAAARAAEAEAVAQEAAGGYGHLSSDDDFLPPLQNRPQRNLPSEQSRYNSSNAAGPSRSLNGFAQHAQRGQAASTPAGSDDAKQPASRNGYQVHHPHQHNRQLAHSERHPGGSERQTWDLDGASAQSRQLNGQHRHHRSHDHQPGSGLLPEAGAQDSEADVRFSVESGYRQHALPLSRNEPMNAEGSWDGTHAQLRHSGEAIQLPGELPGSRLAARRPDSEEADDKFDWGAWMSPEGERKAIAERLQRARRPPKRPYPLPEPPKPKPKKHQSLRGSSQHRDAMHQHRLPDRLLRQESGSTSSGQFSQEFSHAHGPAQHAHKHRLGSAIPGRSAASQKAGKGKSKGRRALEEVGCVRAAAYQGEAFMQARMDVLQQQGVVPGNQAPADTDHGHQVCCTRTAPQPSIPARPPLPFPPARPSLSRLRPRGGLVMNQLSSICP